MLRDSRMVLIQFSPEDIGAPADLSALGLSRIWTALNNALKALDKKARNARTPEEGEVSPLAPDMVAIGLRRTSSSAYLAEFDSTDSAARFCHYMSMDWLLLSDLFRDSAVIVDKSYGLITRFVPCTGQFYPSLATCLCTVE